MAIKIALIQTSCSADKKANTAKSSLKIREAAAAGAKIICTQELYQSLYFCQTHDASFFDLAESIPGPTTNETGKLAKELGVVIVSSLFEKRSAGLFHNTATVHDADGSLLGIYRKMHIPEDPGFHEKYYFTPGDTGYKVFDTAFGKVGVLICWDQWFPEASRLTALKGAEIIFYPTAIGVLPDEDEKLKNEFMQAWEVMHRSHAVANGCFIAAVNRVGQEDSIQFWGDSLVAGPFGQILAQADDKERILYADCDFASLDEQRQTWPFFRDRRIESYKGLLKRADN